jgi:hypothetical protein
MVCTEDSVEMSYIIVATRPFYFILIFVLKIIAARMCTVQHIRNVMNLLAAHSI